MSNTTCSLRRVTQDDLGLILEWRNSETVRSKMYTSHIISEAEHANWWSKVSVQTDFVAYLFEDSMKPTGFLSFSDIDWQCKQCNWGCYVAPGSKIGIGAKLEFLALDEAFFQLGMKVLMCEVLALNSSVITMHKHFGFEVHSRSQRIVSGVEQEIVQMGIESESWSLQRVLLVDRLWGT